MRELSIKVKPNALASSLEELPDGSWCAVLRSPPVDGKANAELIRLVADHFGIPRADVELRRGAAGRLKRVRIP